MRKKRKAKKTYLRTSIPSATWRLLNQDNEILADMVNHPPHYTKGAVEVIKLIEQIAADYPGSEAYSVGCVLKYLARAPHKGNKWEDIKKAHWYLSNLLGIK